MAKDEKDGRFFAVRDLPDETRKKIKRYAVDNDLTMGQALEAIVDSVQHVHDPQLFDALLELYRRVVADDMTGARRETEKIQRLLEQAGMAGV